MGRKLFIYRYQKETRPRESNRNSSVKWTFLSILIFFVVLAILPLLLRNKSRKSGYLPESSGSNVLIKKVPFPSVKEKIPMPITSQVKHESGLPIPKKSEREVKKESREVFIVQVGAFKKKKNALILLRKLRKRGYAVSLSPGKYHESGVIYHVFLNPVKSLDQANKLVKRLEQGENIKNIFIKTISRGEK